MACYFPYLTREQVTVPCGRCPDCRKKHVNGWVFRLLQHSRTFGSPLFITLTYDNINLNVTERGYLTLCKRDCQLFFKRLRKSLPSAKISYYLAGEYGSNRARPHYHIILFGASVASVYKAWTLGNVDISTEPVTDKAMGYTAGYTMKGHRYTMSKNDDRVPEFALMSKGLGYSYLQSNGVYYHRNSIVPYLMLDGGVRVAMPRYYKDYIFNTPDLKDAIKDMASNLSVKKGNADYEDYVARNGSADGFIDEQNIRRRAATKEFISHSKKKRNL